MLAGETQAIPGLSPAPGWVVFLPGRDVSLRVVEESGAWGSFDLWGLVRGDF
jgi:hypothetical protein